MYRDGVGTVCRYSDQLCRLGFVSLGIWSRLATEFDESGKGNAGAQTQERNITIEIGGKIQVQRVNSRKTR